jgi:hypothetical protein
MQKKAYTARLLLVVLTVSLTFPMVSCTKEKAEAIKSGAEQFRVEGKSALELARNLLKESVAMPLETNEDETKKIVHDFDQNLTVRKRTAGEMSTFVQNILGSGNESEGANRIIDQEFQALEDEYDLFASMFRSLPRGHFFAKSAVEKSERHAIRLTARFIKIADTLQRLPMQFSGKRAALIERLVLAQDIADSVQRNQAVTLASQQLLQLRDQERKAKNAAILQCLKAAEAGKSVTELIHNYSKFTVADMLDLIKDGLSIANAITGGTNPDVKGLVSRYDAFVTNKIKTDDLWKDVLTNELHWSPGSP